MLANVPLVITASFPLRAPYELNSRGVSLSKTHAQTQWEERSPIIIIITIPFILKSFFVA